MSELLIFKGLPYGQVTDSDIRREGIQNGRIDTRKALERQRRAVIQRQQAERMARFKQRAMQTPPVVRMGHPTQVLATEIAGGVSRFSGTVINVGGAHDDFNLFGGGRGGKRSGFHGAGFGDAVTLSNLVAGGSDGLFHSRDWWRKDLGRRTVARLVYAHAKDHIGWARERVRGFNTCAKALDYNFDYGNGTHVNDYLVTTSKADFDAKRYQEHTFDGQLQPTLGESAVARLGRLFMDTGKPLGQTISPYPWKQIMDYRATNGLPSHNDDVKPRAVREAAPFGDTIASRINGLVVEAANVAARNIKKGVTGAGQLLVAKIAELTAQTSPAPSPGPVVPESKMELKPSFLGMPIWIPLTVGGVTIVGLLLWFGRRG